MLPSDEKVRVLRNGKSKFITRKLADNPNFMKENDLVLAEPEDFAEVLERIEDPLPVEGEVIETSIPAQPAPEALPAEKQKAKPGPKTKSK